MRGKVLRGETAGSAISEVAVQSKGVGVPLGYFPSFQRGLSTGSGITSDRRASPDP